MQIWSNEAQERYVLAIDASRLDEFRGFCERERCPFAVVARRARGTAGRRRPALRQRAGEHAARGPARQAAAHASRGEAARSAAAARSSADDPQGSGVSRAAPSHGRGQDFPRDHRRPHRGRALRARPDGGPWQVPVADCAVTAMGFETYVGEAMAIGERTPLALLDGPAPGAWRSARPSPTSPRAHREAGRREAFRQLDVRRGSSGRGTPRSTTRSRGGHGALPGARHLDSGRQGLHVRCARRGATRRRARTSR
jgi:hypothetical protein